MEKLLRKQASKQASKPDLHRLSCGFIDGSGKRAMKLSDEVVAAFVRAGTTRRQSPSARAFLELDKRTAARRSRAPARRRFLIYTRLLKIEGTRRFIPKAESLERLKRPKVAYFDSAAAGDHGPDSNLHNGRHAPVYRAHAQGLGNR